jgi:hypothetical protein
MMTWSFESFLRNKCGAFAKYELCCDYRSLRRSLNGSAARYGNVIKDEVVFCRCRELERCS